MFSLLYRCLALVFRSWHRYFESFVSIKYSVLVLSYNHDSTLQSVLQNKYY